MLVSANENHTAWVCAPASNSSKRCHFCCHLREETAAESEILNFNPVPVWNEEKPLWSMQRSLLGCPWILFSWTRRDRNTCLCSIPNKNKIKVQKSPPDSQGTHSWGELSPCHVPMGSVSDRPLQGWWHTSPVLLYAWASKAASPWCGGNAPLKAWLKPFRFLICHGQEARLRFCWSGVSRPQGSHISYVILASLFTSRPQLPYFQSLGNNSL